VLSSESSLHADEDLIRRWQQAIPDHPSAAPDRGDTSRMHLRRSAQVLVEPVQRVLPSLLCSDFVVSAGRVVVETVVGALLDLTLVRHMGFRQRSVESRPPIGDPLVEFVHIAH
jgi:hypothetical protein